MDLTPYLTDLRSQLAAVAETGGPQARDLADRLAGALESAFRLSLLDALSVATAEITQELAPGSVELRLRGRDPEFVVTPPPLDHPANSGPSDAMAQRPTSVAASVGEGDDAGPSRITLRLPEQLKGRIEEAAGRDGVSVNSWLVRTVSAAVGATDPQRSARSNPLGGQSFTGWAH